MAQGAYLFRKGHPPIYFDGISFNKPVASYELYEDQARLLNDDGVWGYIQRSVRTIEMKNQHQIQYFWKSIGFDQEHHVPREYLAQALLLGR